jgi:hypothetical protein
LLVRSLDWVPAIATLARNQAVIQLARASDLELAACVPTAVRFDLDRELAELVRSEAQSRPGLLRGVRWTMTPRDESNLLARDWLADDETVTEVVVQAARQRDPWVTRESERWLAKLPASEQERLLDELITSPSRRIRLATVTVAAKSGRRDLLWRAVDDPFWQIRARARNELSGQLVADFFGHYSARLPEPSAIAGFGEVAPESELGTLLPLLATVGAAQRKEIVRVLRFRKVSGSSDQLVSLLRDPSRKVAKEAVRALETLRVPLDAQFVHDLIAASPKSSRRTLARTATLVPRWDSLTLLLVLVRKHGIDTELLEAWSQGIPRTYAPPTSEQLKAANNAYQAALGDLPDYIVRSLSAEFQFWSSRVKSH